MTYGLAKRLCANYSAVLPAFSDTSSADCTDFVSWARYLPFSLDHSIPPIQTILSYLSRQSFNYSVNEAIAFGMERPIDKDAVNGTFSTSDGQKSVTIDRVDLVWSKEDDVCLGYSSIFGPKNPVTEPPKNETPYVGYAVIDCDNGKNFRLLTFCQLPAFVGMTFSLFGHVWSNVSSEIDDGAKICCGITFELLL